MGNSDVSDKRGRAQLPRVLGLREAVALGGGACLVLLASSGSIGVLGGVSWLLIGLLVYQQRSGRHRLRRAEPLNR
jgi:hypothetical protein